MITNRTNDTKSICIDLRMLFSSGIGTYIRNLIPYIVNYYPKVNFNLLVLSKDLEKLSFLDKSNVCFIECNSRIYSVIEQIELIRRIPKDTTLFWSPHYNIPLLYRGNLLVTVHDLFHLAMPQFVAGINKKLYANIMFNILVKKASAIISVSKFTKNEMIRLVGSPPNLIFPVYNGVDNTWQNIGGKNNPYFKPFILFVGNVKPHKNLVTLIHAFKKIINDVPHDLIIVGKKDGFITEDREVIKQSELLGNRVYFTGYVEEDTLKQYYAFASALVFPSLYEGFGLPPLEAMSFGCPVIASNRASLPEICGDAVLYCDPYSAEDIAKKTLKLINDKKLRVDLQKKGLDHVKNFSWEKCARETLEVIEEVLSR